MKHGTAAGGKSVTLGLNTTPEIAAAIRRAGNRGASISAVLWGLIDEKKLARLMQTDRERMAGGSRGQQPKPGRPEMN